MNSEQYRERIMVGLDGLPPDILAQIFDYVYFLRQRTLTPESFATAVSEMVLRAERHAMNQHEWAHLEEEFADYK